MNNRGKILFSHFFMRNPTPWYFIRNQERSLYVVYATVGLFFLWIGIHLNKIVSETIGSQLNRELL